MRELSDHELKMLVFRDPTLKRAADSYRYCWTLLPDAVYELDLQIKRLGLNAEIEDNAEVKYLRANVQLISQELDISERFVLDALRQEHLQYESP